MKFKGAIISRNRTVKFQLHQNRFPALTCLISIHINTHISVKMKYHAHKNKQLRNSPK